MNVLALVFQFLSLLLLLLLLLVLVAPIPLAGSWLPGTRPRSRPVAAAEQVGRLITPEAGFFVWGSRWRTPLTYYVEG